MRVVPVPVKKDSLQSRTFYVIPKRGGINIVSTITEQEHLALETLIQQFSEHLPHRGGVSPVFAHSMPWIPVR